MRKGQTLVDLQRREALHCSLCSSWILDLGGAQYKHLESFCRRFFSFPALKGIIISGCSAHYFAQFSTQQHTLYNSLSMQCTHWQQYTVHNITLSHHLPSVSSWTYIWLEGDTSYTALCILSIDWNRTEFGLQCCTKQHAQHQYSKHQRGAYFSGDGENTYKSTQEYTVNKRVHNCIHEYTEYTRVHSIHKSSFKYNL